MSCQECGAGFLKHDLPWNSGPNPTGKCNRCWNIKHHPELGPCPGCHRGLRMPEAGRKDANPVKCFDCHPKGKADMS